MNTTQLLLALIAVLIAFGIGFYIARVSVPGAGTGTSTMESKGTTDDGTPGTDGTAPAGETQTEATTIDAGSLTDGQRKLLNALGINADEITVTPEMEACAEAKLGRARLDEIINGATPSFTEGVSLVGCYK